MVPHFRTVRIILARTGRVVARGVLRWGIMIELVGVQRRHPGIHHMVPEAAVRPTYREQVGTGTFTVSLPIDNQLLSTFSQNLGRNQSERSHPVLGDAARLNRYSLVCMIEIDVS